jgi:metal-responsive CopG/Arc/MetJ family transcriptional regulator
VLAGSRKRTSSLLLGGKGCLRRDVTAVQVQLPDDALIAIDEMARCEGITRTEALVRAVKAVGELPDATLRALDEMAASQGISRVEAVVRAVETTKEPPVYNRWVVPGR